MLCVASEVCSHPLLRHRCWTLQHSYNRGKVTAALHGCMVSYSCQLPLELSIIRLLLVVLRCFGGDLPPKHPRIVHLDRPLYTTVSEGVFFMCASRSQVQVGLLSLQSQHLQHVTRPGKHALLASRQRATSIQTPKGQQLRQLQHFAANPCPSVQRNVQRSIC